MSVNECHVSMVVMLGTGVTAADLQQYRDDRRNNTLRHVCEGCALGKMHKNAVSKEKALRASRKLQLVHLDLVGPFKHGAIGNNNSKLAAVFVDDFTRMVHVYGLRSKDESLEALQKFRAAMEKDGDVLEVIQCDNANEFRFGKFAAYCLHNGIHQRFSLPYRQWQNGVAERANRTLIEMANCLLWNTRLSGGYWLLAMQ